MDDGPTAGAASILLHECGYLAEVADWDHERVCSPFWRLYLDDASGAWVEFAGQRVRLGPDHVVVVPENVEFNCRARRARPHLWVHFSWGAYIRLREPGPLRLRLAAGAKAVADTLKATLQQGDATPGELAHLAYALVHLVVGQVPLTMEESLTPRLAETLAYLHQGPTGRVHNADLARRAGVGLRTFLTLFRQQTGDTPAHYLQGLRLREAARRLVMTRASVEEVAAGCGFANRHHFTRQFAVRFGCGPAAFRRAAGRAPK